MRTELFWLLSFGGFAAMSLLCGILVWPQLVAAWPSIEEAIDRFRRLPPLAKLVLMLFVGAFVVYGSTKTNLVDQTSGTNMVEIVEGGTNDVDVVEGGTNDVIIVEGGTNDVGEIDFEGGTNEVEIADGDTTNTPPMMLMMAMPFFGDQPPTVTPEDIARGWQLWEVRTNCNISYTMPEGATLATNWWVRGAYEDVKPFDFGSWRFPFGTNEYSSLWAFTWGKVRFALADTNTEIVAVGAPMSAVPYRSRLWSAETTNSMLITWEDFTLGRVSSADYQLPSTNYQLVSAQIELRTTGDFVTRSNEVETVYRRVDPDDWDDDGWRNDDDPDPYVWEEYWDSFWQELPDGANESAYCWIEIRPRWHSYIEFVGDGPSDLDDPYLWAKAGETYRVQLLIGKSYTIVSSQPVDVVGLSNPSIEIDGSGTSEIDVVWPVTFSALEGNGSGFMMRVVPAGLGGTFTWTQHCCTITGYGNQFWWAHERYCYCGGCYAHGFYSYEGYEKECTGGHCCCPRYDDDDPYEPQEDDGPYAAGASVEFSESVVIFEDAYTNMPGEVVARQSTRTTLTCIAHGGETGGTATFSIENGNKLIACSGGSLPVTRFVPPLQKVEFEIVYEGQLPSGSARDIRAKADFTERVTGTRHSTQRDWLTSVKVELEANQSAPDPEASNFRHKYGIYEQVDFCHYPSTMSVSWRFSADEYYISVVGDHFFCTPRADHGTAEVSAGGVSYTTDFDVVEPQVFATNAMANVSGVSPVEGESGHLLLYLDLYAKPFYVSFKGLNIQEVPDESQSGAHSGYYDDRSKGGPWSHVAGEHMAGWWNEVNAAGYFGTDRAGRGARYDPPWIQGSKTWPIPMAWSPTPNDYFMQMFSPNPTSQHFSISSNGTFRIEKFDHWAERPIRGPILVDGVAIQ